MGIIDILEKSNEKMRVLNYQFKIKHENQRAFLAAHKETHLFSVGRQKRLRNGFKTL